MSKERKDININKEIEKVEVASQQFEKEIKDLTLDRMNTAPKEEVEMQTKISQKELGKKDPIYLKPKRTIFSTEKFNEKYRKEFEYASERVEFIAENNEVIGENIDLWTKKFPGQPAEEWEVPTNKPVNGPRYLAEQIKSCTYHRLVMEDRPVSIDGRGHTYTGQMIADTTKQRLDAHPLGNRKSVFMGASGF